MSPLLPALAALSAPALRTVRWHFAGEPVFSSKGSYCRLSAVPYEPLDVEWLWELTWLTVTAERAGLPTVAMALGLVAVLAFKKVWAARVTAALMMWLSRVVALARSR